MAATAAALVAGDAAPVKIATFVGMSLLVAAHGWRLCGPLLALAVVLPEGGGVRPAALPFLTLLLWPLGVRALCDHPRRLAGISPMLGLLALCTAGLCAAAVGLIARDAHPGTVLFELFAPHVHMLAFVVFALAPYPDTREESVPSNDRWLFGGASVAGALGIAQVLGGQSVVDTTFRLTQALGYASRDFATIDQQLWWGIRKAYAGFFSPNGLGAAMAFTLVLAAGHLSSRKPTRGRNLLWASACVAWLALLLTFSRGALLAAVVGLALVALVNRPRIGSAPGRALLVGGLMLPALHAGLLFESPDVVTTAGAPQVATEIKAQTAAMKVDELRRAIAMFRQGSWLGSGYGVIFQPGVGFVADERAIGVSAPPAEIVYRSGIVGLLALLVALVTFAPLFRDRWRVVREGVHQRRALAASPALMALSTALVLSLIDHPFYTVPGLSILFWGTWGSLAREASPHPNV